MAQVTCLDCKLPLEAAALLNAAAAWDASLDCVHLRCPACAKPFEARLETGRFTHGYVYAAGSAHFSAQLSLDVPELVVEKTRDGLAVTWGDAKRVIPAS